MATKCSWVFSDPKPYWYVSISDVSRLSTSGTCVMSETNWPTYALFVLSISRSFTEVAS